MRHDWRLGATHVRRSEVEPDKERVRNGHSSGSEWLTGALDEDYFVGSDPEQRAHCPCVPPEETSWRPPKGATCRHLVRLNA